VPPPPPLPMFFFGTLMDGDILSAVLGRPAAPDTMEPARLAGWRRVFVPGRIYPMLIPHATGIVDGLLVRDLGDNDRNRLDYYEGPEYRVGTLTVRRPDGSAVPAHTYLCRPAVPAGDAEWRLKTWRLRHKRAALARIRPLMTEMTRVLRI
jgi:hypothetical protein